MRIRSLDGLRGLASLVVAIHHALLCLAPLSLVYFDPLKVERGTKAWWLGFTPLHAAWAGGEAVYLFFVLSGFVLARPFLKGRSGSWRAYFVKRIPRLYIPVWVAVGFALATIWIVPRIPADLPGWLGSHQTKISQSQLLDDLILFRGPAGWSASTLWSLRWEVIFSLSLPVWIAMGSILRKWRLQALGLLLVLYLAVLPYRSDTWTVYRHYLAILVVGVVLASMRTLVPSWLVRPLRTKFGALGGGLFIILLVTWRWTRPGLGWAGPTSWRPYLTALDELTVLVAATMAIIWSVECLLWRRVLETPLLQYLGSRSYSLYLIHEPVVVAYAYTRRGHPTVLGMLTIALPIALLLSEAFFRLVEQPSLHLARRLGTLVARTPSSSLADSACGDDRIGIERP
jgi:peptidoglycan/LPS O-acetylase OafA/YrhL